MTTHYPKVSILMPVYNADAFLEECLDSILGQSFEDWELVAVDDFSEDDTNEILRTYSERDDRIKVFRNKEKGIIPALRLACSESKGAYLTRMDADDVMEVAKLYKMHTLLEEKGPGTVVCGLVEYFAADGEPGKGFVKYAEWLNTGLLGENPFDQIYEECVLPSPCWMISRPDLERVQAFRPGRYPEDYDLVFRFYEAGFRVSVVPEVLHRWRDHSTRASRNDPNYADQNFLALKLEYFLKLDRDASRPLVLWGAGRKGKSLAKLMQGKGEAFHWVTENPKKAGKEIYGKQVESPAELDLEASQVVVCIASPVTVGRLREGHGGREGFFFWYP